MLTVWFLYFGGHCDRRPDIAALRTLVAPAQQNHHQLAAPHEVDPISWTVIDAQFGDSLPDRLDVPEQSVAQARDPLRNPLNGVAIRQSGQPRPENGRLADLDHL
jgi:hypothetical protein